MEPERLDQQLDELTTHPPSLAVVHRVEMLRYVRARLDKITAAVFDKSTRGPEASQHDIRFCRQTVELMVERSLLARAIIDFESMAATVASHATAPDHDLPATWLETRLQDMLSCGRPRILGISTAFWSQLLPALLIARWARARDPKLKIVLGGQQVMLWTEPLRRAAAPWVDGLCVGGGEACLEKLCDAVDGKVAYADVPNLVWLGTPGDRPVARREVALDDLPPPDFDGLPIRGYLSEEAHLAMITCVGCYWGKCVFCAYGNRNPAGRGYQQMSPARIAATCEALTEKHQVDRINFVDENTPVPNVVRAMRILNARGRSIRFSTRNRLDPFLLNPEFCRELFERGCVLMSVGYETNSQRLLDRLNKGVRADTYSRIIENLHEVGIPLRLSVMGGVLDETEAERDESERFLQEHSDKIGIDIMQMLVIEPGTELWRDPARFGVHVGDQEKLRGNAVLNYGMGRMGASFEWVEGEGFEERLHRFRKIFDQVDPQKNDELPPERRKNGPARTDPKNPVTLLPWVRIVEIEGGGRERDRILIDLLWQRFYRVPTDWDLFGVGALVMKDGLPHSAAMFSMIKMGLAAHVAADY
jgi:hypothetical protein